MNTRRIIARRLALAVAITSFAVMAPGAAHATASSGWGWSSGLNSLSNEAKGGLAFVFILLGMIGALVEYQRGGELGGLLTAVARGGVIIGVVGGFVTFASLFGMTAATVLGH